MEDMQNYPAPRPSLAAALQVSPRPVSATPAIDFAELEKKLIEAVTEASNSEAQRLTQIARDAEHATQILNAAIERGIRSNPEALESLEAENVRLLSELQSTQAELARARRALSLAAGEGVPRRFWQRLGSDLAEVAELGLDLLEVGDRIRAGDTGPDIGRRVYSYIKATSDTLEAYSDNCLAYAQEEL